MLSNFDINSLISTTQFQQFMSSKKVSFRFQLLKLRTVPGETTAIEFTLVVSTNDKNRYSSSAQSDDANRTRVKIIVF